MALSADNAQSNYSLHVHFDSIVPQVNLLTKLKRKDFVLVNWHKSLKLAKILDIIDAKVHVRWYLKKLQLPKDVVTIDANNEPIELDDEYEIIENGEESENIDRKLIICKCQVFYAHESGSVRAVIAKHRQMNRDSRKMYVCRFKLVKETVYTLRPVSWSREETISDDESGVNDTDDEPDAHDLSESLRNIALSVQKRESKKLVKPNENKSKRVTPIKIVGESVQKVKRQINNKIDEKHNDDNVSPSKRGKYANEQNGNYLLESPEFDGAKRSHHNRSITKACKNLNSSFGDASFDRDNGDTLNGTDSYSIDPIHSEETMKLKLRKNSATPLKELHDNVTDSPARNLRERVLNKTLQHVTEAISPSTIGRRKSILKKNTKSADPDTPKRNVVINETPNKMNDDSPEQRFTTPSKLRARRSTRLSSVNASAIIKMDAEDQTPPETPKTPKTSKTPQTNKTPKSKTVRDGIQTPKSTGRRSSAVPKTPTNALTPLRKRQLFRAGNLTPSMQSRETAVSNDQNGLETIRERLHVSAVPDSLPCRESEFQSIHAFVEDKLNDECGGCIYISGVPGTGKTATVTQVVRKLQTEAKQNVLPKFDYVEINGMRLTEPRQAYVQIYRQLTGKTLTWAQARDLLEKRFTESKSRSKKQTRSTILLIDELDIICNRKQDVVYNLFDWTSKRYSRLVAITIANTMDLPERVLKLKVASRLGLTRITFQPYSFKQLQEVVMARLAGSNHFVSDAVQLVARKVASVSGDCRRALDICRRATEIAEEMNAKNEIVGFVHVNQALNEMFASPRIKAIKCCTKFEKLFLQAVASEITRTGIEEVDFLGVYAQLQILAPVLGIKNPPNQTSALEISLALGASRLLIVEDSRADIYQKIILNVSVDDLYYALNSQ